MSRFVTASLAAVAFAARMAFGLAVHAPPAWDGTLYERGARAIASGLGYSCFMFGPLADPRVPTAYYPVGYPAYLGVLYTLFGTSAWVIALGGALAGALTVALTHRLALRVASPRAAFAAALALAVMPAQVIFAAAPMTEVLWGALLTLAVYLAARGARWPWLAAALAAAVYVRPQALVLAGLLPLVASGTRAQRLTRTALTVATVLALIAPWTLRNCRAIDGCALVSANGASNLAVGAMARSDGTYLSLTADDGCRGVVGEIARERCWRRVAWARIRENPGAWALRAYPKLRHTFSYERAPIDYLAAARPELLDERARSRGYDLLTLTWRLCAGLALLALVPLRGRRPLDDAGRLSLATVLAMGATHAVFFGGDRYHLPLAGPLCVLAAGAFRDAPAWLRGLRERPPRAG